MVENAGIIIDTKLSLHGSSSTSSRHSMTTLTIPNNSTKEPPMEFLVYSSHGIINLATTSKTMDTSELTTITTVEKTLRSQRINKQAIITALTRIDSNHSSKHLQSNDQISILAAGYSNGGISLWYHKPNHSWKEIILLESASSSQAESSSSTDSITDISGIYHCHFDLLVLSTATAHGLTIYQFSFKDIITQSMLVLTNDVYKVQHIAKCGSLASVLVTSRISPYCFHNRTTEDENNGDDTSSSVETLIFCGTALPRHNKVWVYTSTSNQSISNSDGTISKEIHPFMTHGYLIGHEDWITCLAWKPLLSSSSSTTEPEYFLASGSHDAKIRLWRFQPSTVSTVVDLDDNEMENNANIDDDDDASDSSDDEELLDSLLEEEGEARLILKHLINQSSIAVTLEALMIGHEESITSLCWKPSTMNHNNNDKEEELCIVSSSMDKAILLWSPDDAEEGIWIPTSRVGSAGGILGGSIGSSLLGFLNVTFWNKHMEDLMMVAVGFGGSIHFWKLMNSSSSSSNIISASKEDGEDETKSVTEIEDEDQIWEALPCLTGHFKGVSDLDWESVSGEYLLTVSHDQTCRLWSEVNIISSCNTNNFTEKRWMEVGRPQVHGYDLNAITCIGGGNVGNGVDGIVGREPRYRFVSGADEKQLRAFDAPVATLRLVHGLQNQDTKWEQDELVEGDSRVERAYIPSLGLSNKGMASTENQSQTEENALPSTEMESNSTTQLPLERDLGVTTLWPEVRKLYGHESELVCLASTSSINENKGDVLVASACKARDIENAAIRLWDVNSGICVDVLKGGHRSTVATLSFSPNGSFLASSGKDRRLCLWKKNLNITDSDEKKLFNLVAAVDSAHKRIIWSVDFCPHVRNLLASGGRDGFVKIWKIEESEEYDVCELKELFRFEPFSKEGGKKNVSVTAVAFTPVSMTSPDGKESAVLAVGLESGLIELWSISIDPMGNKAVLIREISPSDCHIAAVKKLAWRPCVKNIDDDKNQTGKKLTLASCGLDHGVRLYDIFVKNS